MNDTSTVLLLLSSFLAGMLSLSWVFLSVVAEYDMAKKWAISIGVALLLVVIFISRFPSREVGKVFEYMYNPMKSIRTVKIQKIVPNKRYLGYGDIATVGEKTRIEPTMFFVIGFWGTIIGCPLSLILLRIREEKPNRDFDSKFIRWWRKRAWGKTFKDEI